MIFHVLTIFPEFFAGPFAHGVVKRGQDAGLLDIRIHDLRTWTTDRHRTVDDRPFGGRRHGAEVRADLSGGGKRHLAGAERGRKAIRFRRRAVFDQRWPTGCRRIARCY